MTYNKLLSTLLSVLNYVIASERSECGNLAEDFIPSYLLYF